ncbi:MAG: hypothetical protein ABIB47_06380 [Candidatus Woesearchaeota archaeon]
MKRPGVVWIYVIIVVLNIFFSIGGVYTEYNQLPKVEFSFLLKTIPMLAISMFLSLLILISSIIMIYKFFMLKRNALPWVYATFGLSIIVNLLSRSYIVAIILIVFGWAVVDYIKKKQIGGKILFT